MNTPSSSNNTAPQFATYHGEPVKVIREKWVNGVYCAVIEYKNHWQQTVPMDAVQVNQ